MRESAGELNQSSQQTALLEAGPEIDELVAVKVMGWHRGTCKGGHRAVGHTCEYTWRWYSEDGREQALAEPMHDYYAPQDAWSPSTDIAAAWQVVERLPAKFALVKWMGGWGCSTGNADAHADTAPLAICRAALTAAMFRREPPTRASELSC